MRGKGSGEDVGFREITEKEYLKWGRTMVYKPKPITRDFVDNPSEKEAIKNFFIVLKKVIGEMENFPKK